MYHQGKGTWPCPYLLVGTNTNGLPSPKTTNVIIYKRYLTLILDSYFSIFRLLMIECNKNCPTGDFCTNRSFQRGSKYNLEIIQAGKKGWGLKTNEPISKGVFVIEYCGEVVDYNGFHLRTQSYHEEVPS